MASIGRQGIKGIGAFVKKFSEMAGTRRIFRRTPYGMLLRTEEELRSAFVLGCSRMKQLCYRGGGHISGAVYL